LIINYDMARFMSDYIHRVGRVGRLGSKSGTVLNMIGHRHEVKLVWEIEVSSGWPSLHSGWSMICLVDKTGPHILLLCESDESERTQLYSKLVLNQRFQVHQRIST